MRPLSLLAGCLAVGLSLIASAAPVAVAASPFAQQAGKLIGTGIAAKSNAGMVALSADGRTALVGGPEVDGSGVGGAWVFVRTGTTWAQQGPKLIGTGGVGTPFFGTSVALSDDGNTALIGGSGDSGQVGAAWVFTRSGAVWSQTGNKLTPGGAVGTSRFGRTVALSGDGSTALVGGFTDNSSAGAAWVFTRAGSAWSQQGAKLVGSGTVGAAAFGSSTALSTDGNTALIGGSSDNTAIGAAWVFIRSGVTWSQQGGKLVPSGWAGQPGIGSSAALSSDGNTALIGGIGDNSAAGAAWIFARSAGTWAQTGSKLLPSDRSGAARFGESAALSADGTQAVIGGIGDAGVGAAWVFSRVSGVWSQAGPKLVPNDRTGNAQFGGSAALSSDGTTAAIGGSADSSGKGASWVFGRNRTVTATVVGPGTVSAPGIACPSVCSHDYLPGTDLTLAALPGSGARFVGWGGACSGLGSCALGLEADSALTATFEPIPAQQTTPSGGSQPAGVARAVVPSDVRPLPGLPKLPTSPRALGIYTPKFATRAVLGRRNGEFGLFVGLVPAPGAPAGTKVRLRCLASCGGSGRSLLTRRVTARSRNRMVWLKHSLLVSKSTVIEIRLTHAGFTGRLSRFGFVRRRGALQAKLVGTACLTEVGARPTTCGT